MSLVTRIMRRVYCYDLFSVYIFLVRFVSDDSCASVRPLLSRLQDG